METLNLDYNITGRLSYEYICVNVKKAPVCMMSIFECSAHNSSACTLDLHKSSCIDLKVGFAAPFFSINSVWYCYIVSAGDEELSF